MKIKRIRYLSPLEENDPENDNMDVHATLDDGRTYSFIISTPNNIYKCMENEGGDIISTPNNIYKCMENEGGDYFFGIPMIFVKYLTADCIEHALTAIVTEDEGKWLELYGALQNDPTNM